MLLFLVGLYGVASLVSFVMYAIDKRAAQAGRRRLSERSLLWVGVAGGWPGAALAQRTLRHKSAKPSFRWRFMASVVLNLLLLAGLVYLTLYLEHT